MPPSHRKKTKRQQSPKRDSFLNILNLPDWEILAAQENHDDYLFTAQYTKPTVSCPQCNTMFPRLKRFGTRQQLFLDLPIHAKRVGILVHRQRYLCHECQRTFIQALPDMHDYRRATKRLVEYVEQESLKRTFSSIASDVGLTEGAIRFIFQDYIPRLERHLKSNIAPRWMGIDEITIVGKPRGVITNIEKQTIVELLDDRKKKTITQYLMRFKDRAKIEVVTMDMWQPYREAVQTALPNALIVIDKFHILRMANAALDVVRKNVREGLTPAQRRKLMHDRFILLKRKKELEPHELLVMGAWLGQFPPLKAAYELKEKFYGIWERAKDSADAQKRYREWETSIPADIVWAFNDLMTAIRNWESEVFAYFDHRLTNAYTESLNNIIRLIYRVGRGYSFEAIRAKLLFNGGLHIERRSRYSLRGRVLRETSPAMSMVSLLQQPEGDTEILNYGVKISTLVHMLENEGE